VIITEQYRYVRAVSPAAVILATPLERDLQYLRRVAEQSALVSMEAATGREALAAISHTGAGAVICDESLPWRDLLSYLAEDCDPPRVIVIASAPQNTMWAEVLSLGGFDVLAKPFVEDEVSRLMGMVCARPPHYTRPRPPVARDVSLHQGREICHGKAAAA
jgi:DNA-binding response OmpR family regulator